ncbi:MAG TPA: amidohydrolase family protein, partial [Longimicrobiaceae bacterium]|nr:amidohydrolase family protein [Longimicrobiaceae bacterium]
YRATPADFRADGVTARLAAYLTRGEGEAARHFGHMVLALRRETDRGWRIAAETLTFPGPETYPPLTVDELVPLLDAAGIRRAVVLSAAYMWGSPLRADRFTDQDEYALVRADNDWVSRQVARYPDRLRGFCGVSPLREYALEEVERCHRDPHLDGIKLHFANSGVDLRDPEHVERVRRVFAAANQRRMPVVVHLRTWNIPYGRELTRLFLDRIVPAAPDIPIQVAHMAASGPGWEDREADEALAAFADAAAAGDPRMRNLWFDLATVVTLNVTPQTAERLAGHIRRLGAHRVVYGSDMAVAGNPAPRQGWALVKGLLPLTDRELAAIATNVVPYMR